MKNNDTSLTIVSTICLGNIRKKTIIKTIEQRMDKGVYGMQSLKCSSIFRYLHDIPFHNPSPRMKLFVSIVDFSVIAMSRHRKMLVP